MKNLLTLSLLSVFFLLFLPSFSRAATSESFIRENYIRQYIFRENFIQCLTRFARDSHSITKLIYTPFNSSYTPIFEFSMRNQRFNTSARVKPQVIVTPVDESQVQTVLYCAKKHDMQIRTRGGGHDFEGLSYTSTYQVPFVLLDMINLRAIEVDLDTGIATVQAGATLGELYYAINSKSSTLTFPAGIWSTVGVTGFLCGGGYGGLRRKYGLGADNVIDARLMDVNGRILNRRSMGEDLFWAIRGGGCASFGIILSWELQLVSVPEIVTGFNVFKTLEQDATKILHKWQYIAPNLPQDLDVRIHITTILGNSSVRADKKTVQVGFSALFLGGGIDALLPLMEESFPELGLRKEDCLEMNWITSVMLFSSFDRFSSNPTPEDLLDRTFLADIPIKGKSDFVREPIPVQGLKKIWKRLLEVQPGDTTVIFTPYGGKMSEISENATPFPHRAGTLFMVYTRILWVGNTTEKLGWIRSLYADMTPYVSKNPRTAYLNYDDLDLGVNNPEGSTSYAQASKWGKSYYKNNFDRLVRIKTKVDPGNFFRKEQSIPPLSLRLSSDV